MTDTGDLVFGVGYMASHFQLQTLNDDPVFTYRECSGGAEEDGAASSGYGKVEIFAHKIQKVLLGINYCCASRQQYFYHDTSLS